MAISLSKSQFAKLQASRVDPPEMPRKARRIVLPKGQPPITLEAFLLTDCVGIEKQLRPGVDDCGGTRFLVREFIAALKLTLHGVMRTKKNSQRIFALKGTQPRALPSAAYCAWCDAATTAVMLAKLGDLKLNFDMNFQAVFYMPKDNCDLTGLKDGLADFAQKAGLITNDKLIRRWDGSKVVIDRNHPRVELLISSTQGVGN